MQYDLAVPKGNETNLLARAKELGIELVFLYEGLTMKKLLEKRKKYPKKMIGLLIRASKPQDLRVNLALLKQVDLVVASSIDPDLVRKIVENKNIDLFVNISSSTGRDHLHYRRSNLNQVLAKLAVSNKQSYVLDFSRILKTESSKRVALLGRQMQNIFFCQKYKIPILIASFAENVFELRNLSDLHAFARVLGANKPTLIEDILAKKKMAKTFVRDGVRVIQ